jgi:hypothetical protein
MPAELDGNHAQRRIHRQTKLAKQAADFLLREEGVSHRLARLAAQPEVLQLWEFRGQYP